MKRQTFADSRLREEWDTDTRLYTAWDAQGAQTEQRPFTPTENVRADAEVAQETQDGNDRTLRDRAATALDTNRSFLTLGNPSNAQTLAQVRALTRQNNGLIRLVIGRLDGTD